MQIFICMLLYSLLWVFATPLAFTLLRSIEYKSRIIIQVLFFSLILSTIGFMTFWVLLIPALTVELAIFTSRYRPLSKDFRFQFSILAALALVHLCLYVIFDYLKPEELNTQLSFWFSHIDNYFDKMAIQLGENTESFKFLKKTWSELLNYVPSVYFGGFVLGYYSCFWRTRLLANFKCPDSIFWLTLITFSFGFLNLDKQYLEFFGEYATTILSYKIVFKNVFLVFCSLYLFQGLSVSLYFMERLKISRFWQNLWYILIIFNLPMILVAIGIFDFLFEFRTFKEKK